MAEKKRILSVAAHGDDVEFFAGGTLAKMAAEGHDVYLCIATNNERGSFRLHMEELRAIARPEAEASCKALGGCGVYMLGYTDGDLCDETKTVLRGKVMRVIREVQADIVFSWDPFAPYEPHPDHRAIAWATMEAATFSHFPLFHSEQFDEGLKPHKVAEMYYYSKAEWETNLIVDVTDTIETKLNALYGYDCQMVLTIDDIIHGARAAGVPESRLNLIDPYDYKPLIAAGIKRRASVVGAKIGVTYAEAFRHEKEEVPEVFKEEPKA
jgi:LmbE family N-acetylglucosaminyl deacetylase